MWYSLHTQHFETPLSYFRIAAITLGYRSLFINSMLVSNFRGAVQTFGGAKRKGAEMPKSAPFQIFRIELSDGMADERGLCLRGRLAAVGS